MEKLENISYSKTNYVDLHMERVYNESIVYFSHVFLQLKGEIMHKFSQFYNALEDFKRENGHLDVPGGYVTASGYQLGYYVSQVRHGRISIHPSEQIILDEMGFHMEYTRTYTPRQRFERVYEMLLEYKSREGHLKIPKYYQTEDGINLGSIVHAIRQGNRKITPEEKEMLDEISFFDKTQTIDDQMLIVWGKNQVRYDFDQIYELLQEYCDEHGNCDVPTRYVTPNGVHLGAFVRNIRSGARKTSPKEREKLDMLGFIWKKYKKERTFEEIYPYLASFYEEHKHCEIPYYYRNAEGISVGKLAHQLVLQKDMLTKEQVALLESIQFYFPERKRQMSFMKKYELLKEYQKEHGNLLVPQNYVTPSGEALGKIVMRFRQKNVATEEERKALDELGFVWRVKAHKLATFEDVCDNLREYQSKFGNCDVPYYYVSKDGMRLGFIVINIRTGHRKTTQEQKDMLNKIGFVW